MLGINVLRGLLCFADEKPDSASESQKIGLKDTSKTGRICPNRFFELTHVLPGKRDA